jgi:hypothetical protein
MKQSNGVNILLGALLAALALVEVVLLFYGVALSLPRSGSYRTVVTKVSSDGTETISQSPWTSVSPREMQGAKRRTLPMRLAIFFFLALNTVGITYLVRGLKSGAKRPIPLPAQESQSSPLLTPSRVKTY